MPTTRHRVPRLQRPELPPAAIFLLTTGRFSQAYLPGWATLHWAMQPFQHDPRAWRASVWTVEVQAWFEAEALAAGFQPWALSGSCPRGAAVTQWERRFLAEHGRRD